MKSTIDFQDSGYGSHLGFSIGTILLFYVQVTMMVPSFENWPFGSGEEAKMAAMAATLDFRLQ